MCRGQRHEVGGGEGSHVEHEGDGAGEASRKRARHQLGALFLPAHFVGDRMEMGVGIRRTAGTQGQGQS
jgi:hypothetical protein